MLCSPDMCLAPDELVISTSSGEHKIMITSGDHEVISHMQEIISHALKMILQSQDDTCLNIYYNNLSRALSKLVPFRPIIFLPYQVKEHGTLLYSLKF